MATIASVKSCDIVLWFGFTDGYYRMILSYDELTSALDKLQKSGLVIFEDDNLYCTERAQKILIGRNRLGALSWIFKVQERIKKRQFEDLFDVRFTISKTEYDQQLKKYNHNVWKAFKSIK